MVCKKDQSNLLTLSFSEETNAREFLAALTVLGVEVKYDLFLYVSNSHAIWRLGVVKNGLISIKMK